MHVLLFFPVFVLFFRCSDRANFFYAFVPYFHLVYVQRTSFCHCFLIFNPAVFYVDDGVISWLKKIRNLSLLLL